MAIDERFSPEEWRLIRAAPALIGSGMVAADPGGLISLVKEAVAMGGSTRDTLLEHRDNALLKAIIEARDEGIKAELDAVLDGAGSAMDRRDRLQTGALERLRAALAVLEAKADPEEVEAYKQWIRTMARRVAEAGKEGGFLGFGGVRVTESEKRFLDRVEALAD